MQIIHELEQLGFTFQVEDNRLKFNSSHRKIHSSTAKQLLEKLKAEKQAAIEFLRSRVQLAFNDFNNAFYKTMEGIQYKPGTFDYIRENCPEMQQQKLKLEKQIGDMLGQAETKPGQELFQQFQVKLEEYTEHHRVMRQKWEMVPGWARQAQIIIARSDSN